MRLLNKDKSGMLFLDLITSLIIICFLIWVFGGIISPLSKYARETALRYQLNNFRMVIMLYKVLKGRYPPDLKVLMETDYKVSKEDKPILSEKLLFNSKQDARKDVLDAFGNRFYYDRRTGLIRSQTKGYGNW